jgi:hypothetical protein
MCNNLSSGHVKSSHHTLIWCNYFLSGVYWLQYSIENWVSMQDLAGRTIRVDYATQRAPGERTGGSPRGSGGGNYGGNSDFNGGSRFGGNSEWR